MEKVEHAISTRSFFMVLIVALGIFLAWKLSTILILIVTALMLAATLDPLVAWFNKKLPLTLSAAIVMIILVLPIIFVFVTMIPAFIDQFSNIVQVVNRFIGSNVYLPKIFHNIDLSQYTKEGGQYILDSTAAFTGFIVQLVMLIFLTFYLLIDAKRLHNFFSLLIPQKNRVLVEKVLGEVATISGKYIRGNIFISIICGTIIFIGLTIMRVPNAGSLAVFAGIMDLLPLVGGTIGAVPAVILAFTVSPTVGLLTIILYIAYQQSENYILVPGIYKKTLNMIPFLSFISVIVGSMLFGVVGAFLALPIAASIPTIIHNLNSLKYKEKN